jgi:hypothetical protein
MCCLSLGLSSQGDDGRGKRGIPMLIQFAIAPEQGLLPHQRWYVASVLLRFKLRRPYTSSANLRLNCSASLEVKSKAPNGVTFNVKGKSAHDGPIAGSVRLAHSLKYCCFMKLHADIPSSSRLNTSMLLLVNAPMMIASGSHPTQNTPKDLIKAWLSILHVPSACPHPLESFSRQGLPNID